MRKCRNCLCRNCMNDCCNGIECKGKKKECNQYSGWRQMSIFDILNEPQKEEQEYKAAPRYSWKYYGLENKRYRKKLKLMMQSKEYAHIARYSAYETNKDIAEYILLSINKNISYEGLQRLWDLREIERMPCGRSDFYGWRRYFFSCFDKELGRMGK